MATIDTPTATIIPPQSMTNWAAIIGRWSFSGRNATYLGPDDRSELIMPVGICVTNFQLTEGKLSCRVKLPDAVSEGRVLFGYRSPDERYIMAGIGGWKRAYSVGEFDPTLAGEVSPSRETLITSLQIGGTPRLPKLPDRSCE